MDPANLKAYAGIANDEPHEDPGEQADPYAALVPVLEKHAAEIDACCDELDPKVLEDYSAKVGADDREILAQVFDTLDLDARQALMAHTPGITIKNARRLADHLAQEHLAEDPDRMAGWLFRIGQLVQAGAVHEHTKPGEESPEELPSDDEVGTGDLADAPELDSMAKVRGLL